MIQGVKEKTGENGDLPPKIGKNRGFGTNKKSFNRAKRPKQTHKYLKALGKRTHLS